MYIYIIYYIYYIYHVCLCVYVSLMCIDGEVAGELLQFCMPCYMPASHPLLHASLHPTHAIRLVNYLYLCEKCLASLS